MTNAYRWVTWNRHKRVYDAFVVGAILLGIGGFAAGTALTADDSPDPVVVLMRALGLTAFTLLHVILCIGPLARLTDRALPLLYNRRHLGVATFLVALAHAVIVFGYYGGFGVIDPFSAVLFSDRSFGSLAAFPYELLGFGALLILFALAATSHDFWLAQLSPSVWKGLHMSVYGAYGLVVGHVALGALRDQAGPVSITALVAGVTVVFALHAVTGVRELARDGGGVEPPAGEGAGETPWVPIGLVDEIPERRAKVVCLRGQERVAVFRHAGRVSAVTNVCAHQGGPLGEGKIVDGCVTCPWHGYQYDASTGRSPPPYTEKIATYRVRVEGREVYLDPRPLPPGTAVEPAVYDATPDDEMLFEPVEKTVRVGGGGRPAGGGVDEVDPDLADTAAGIEHLPEIDPEAREEERR